MGREGRVVTAVELAIALALGLIFGSFANVCIRMPNTRSIVWPGSACPACGGEIAWYDNVPVVSWLLLGGRCRWCSAPISWRYPLVETISALLLVHLCLGYGLTLVGRAVVSGDLDSDPVPIDWKHGILPDLITLPGIAVGLLMSLVTREPGMVDSILGTAVGGLALS